MSRGLTLEIEQEVFSLSTRVGLEPTAALYPCILALCREGGYALPTELPSVLESDFRPQPP